MTNLTRISIRVWQIRSVFYEPDPIRFFFQVSLGLAMVKLDEMEEASFVFHDGQHLLLQSHLFLQYI